MALYCIGEVQGCNAALGRLLERLDFSPGRDTLFMLGDLVNRGPDNAGVLRRLMQLGGAARCLLGNHDLHLLAVAHGVRKPHRNDTVADILSAPDRDAMLHWLRQQRMTMMEGEVLMVHAGVLPQWSANDVLALAAEVEAVLRGPDLAEFLPLMYGNKPARWNEELTGTDRLWVIVNALTRLRFCDARGKMEFDAKEGADAAPPGFMTWFDVPGRRTADVTMAFGHWSTLGWLGRADLYALDSGCVWGGCLSALRLDAAGAHEHIQVKCPQAMAPGG